MKRLSKFLDYIVESKEIDKDDLDEYLLDIRELGIQCDYREGGVITDANDEFVGRGYKCIVFGMTDLDKSGIGSSTAISDNVIWEFLEELLVFKNRLESDKVYIRFHGSEWIYVYFLTNEEKSGKDFELINLYNIILNRSLSGKSDFHHSIVSRIIDDKITISCDEYTDRKFNSLLRGVDLSAFNIEKTIHSGRFCDECDVVITHK